MFLLRQTIQQQTHINTLGHLSWSDWGELWIGVTVISVYVFGWVLYGRVMIYNEIFYAVKKPGRGTGGLMRRCFPEHVFVGFLY